MTQFFTLSDREATATQFALDIIHGEAWAKELVARVADGGWPVDGEHTFFV
jgi:hypothetical protein